MVSYARHVLKAVLLHRPLPDRRNLKTIVSCVPTVDSRMAREKPAHEAGPPVAELSASWASSQGASFGNGAAMRVAPVGACFAEDYGQVVAEARASDMSTHVHPDGIAGAVAAWAAAGWFALMFFPVRPRSAA